ncbi:MFS general substrate transporter [Hypoxylon trugodes]|uniref:MFS general substrate transporter n=1 Tax=Hypoxylon trugodes TaxID=326681 RepID=UPI00218E872D|nr:MFS general substrate transporter [Hypoxylon trugodes]KAI1388623.1 MFS general substrate transporter [Hypoxylon trugodes]
MWSYIQYRRMGRDLQQAYERDSKIETYRQARESNSRNVEAAKPDSPLETLGSKERDDTPTNNHSTDKIIVRTDGDDDPIDPKNWPLMARCKNIAILSFLIFSQGWAGAAESMANKTASAEFGVSQVAENLSTAMYLFGVGSGALFAGPLSETVGRNPTYLVSTFCYLFFVLGSALTPTFGGQVVCRLFVGLFSSATLSINGSSVRDQFRPVKRAFAFPIIAWANVAAPVIAPIAGGWIVSNPNLSWRWTEWVTLIISGLAFLVSLFFLPETYLPLLLDWKAKHLRRLTGDNRYVSEHAESASFIRKLRQVGPLPMKFLTQEPVIAILGGYLILLYVLLFSFLSGFDYIFKETYQLSTALTGSCFASIAAGATFFTLLAPGFYSWARWKTEYVRGAPIDPEFRLWPAIIAAPLLAISLFWLGWSDQQNVSIWSSLGACFVFGMVIIAIYVASYEYIIDSYGDHAAIGLASITIVRYLVAGGMVMAARPMYEGIGTHWTMTLLGGVAVVLLPAPLFFWRYGRKLRARSPYAKSP